MNYHTNTVPLPIKERMQEDPPVVQHIPEIPEGLYLVIKRFFDLLFSAFFTLVVLSWLVPVVALLILIDSQGPVFFIQRRIGKNGRIFRCIKFRTMIHNDEADEKQAEENDYRITRVGRILRKTNIDEFPQFLNVLIGDMSIIGPRPHMVSDCTRFSFVIPSYKYRSLVRPGITGLAQVKGYHGPTVDYESIFNRFHWDAEYIKSLSFMLDCRIVFLTVFQSLGNIIHLTRSYFSR